MYTMFLEIACGVDRIKLALEKDQMVLLLVWCNVYRQVMLVLALCLIHCGDVSLPVLKFRIGWR
jgi:hypothetical protein